MKKLLFACAILFAFDVAKAQDGGRIFKKFKGNVSIGYANFPGNNSNTGIKNGFVFSLEPKYAVLDQLALGLRIETILLGKGGTSTVGGTTANDNLTLKVYGTYLLTADFYFTNNYKLRPFVGAGGGIYYAATASTLYDDPNTNSHTTKFGEMG